MADAKDGGARGSALIPVKRVVGRPIPLPGNDIDTDRIIPARFMTAITFDGLGELAFRDARFDGDGRPLDHPMNDPRYRAKGARVAIVNKNFGCGSSREHAPQALWRWGIHAIVGESFADIFFGNCVAMGIPCATASAADVARLMEAVREDPAHDLTIDVEACTATYRGATFAVSIPAGARGQLLRGAWDATRILVDALDQVRSTASRLPYVSGFGR
ncbi:MAG TPA: 3-isopropylmalate dehydratase small subunit [Candidatus Binatia bacterium]|nr:3-isopropylmalate dehydratase small subunit [Candidatus Binatia bacterium]